MTGVFAKTRNAVAKASNRKQIPFVTDGLIDADDFCLLPGNALQKQDTPPLILQSKQEATPKSPYQDIAKLRSEVEDLLAQSKMEFKKLEAIPDFPKRTTPDGNADMWRTAAPLSLPGCGSGDIIIERHKEVTHSLIEFNTADKRESLATAKLHFDEIQQTMRQILPSWQVEEASTSKAYYSGVTYSKANNTEGTFSKDSESILSVQLRPFGAGYMLSFQIDYRKYK